MFIKTETSLKDFEWWSGARANADKLTQDEMDALEVALEEWGDWTDTELNDFMWFDFDQVCCILGLTYDEDSGEVIRDEEE